MAFVDERTTSDHDGGDQAPCHGIQLRMRASISRAGRGVSSSSRLRWLLLPTTPKPAHVSVECASRPRCVLPYPTFSYLPYLYGCTFWKGGVWSADSAPLCSERTIVLPEPEFGHNLPEQRNISYLLQVQCQYMRGHGIVSLSMEWTVWSKGSHNGRSRSNKFQAQSILQR